MNKIRIKRTIGTLIGAIALATIVIGIITWFSLPNWTKIQASLSSLRPVPAQPRRSTSESTTSSTTMAPAQETPRELPKIVRGEPKAEPKVAEIAYLLRRFVTGDGPPIRVCENLVNVPPSYPVSYGDFQTALNQMARDNSTDNAFMESSLSPIANTLQLPAVSRFLSAIQAASATNDPAITDNDFHSLSSMAASEVVANRAVLSTQAQHAYHLFVLARAAAMNPSIATNTNAQAFCSHEQTLATASAPETPSQLDAEKAMLLRLLALARLAPEQVGYDPNLANQISVSINSRGMTIQVPWMMKQYGSAFVVGTTAGAGGGSLGVGAGAGSW